MKRAIQVMLLSTFLGLSMGSFSACGNDRASTGSGGDKTVPDMPAGEVLAPENTPADGVGDLDREETEERQELLERGREKEDL
jgi:hypothetical protein